MTCNFAKAKLPGSLVKTKLHEYLSEKSYLAFCRKGADKRGICPEPAFLETDDEMFCQNEVVIDVINMSRGIQRVPVH
jgi:hypothetical protein